MLKAEAFSIDDLHPFHANPRIGEIDEIVASLKKHGQYRTIVVNKGTLTGRPLEILAGNHTWAAMKKLGWKTIDATVIDVDEKKAASIVLADNRIADLGTYDNKILEELLKSLDDLTGTGWTTNDLLDLSSDEPVMLTDPDDCPIIEENPICHSGDIIDLGDSRLYVGDSTDTEHVKKAFSEIADSGDCLWTDPPYGVSYQGKGKEKLTIANDGKEDLPDLLPSAFRTAAALLTAGAPAYIAYADMNRIVFEKSLLHAGFNLRQNLIWVKNAPVIGWSDYLPKHEPILFADSPYMDDSSPVLYGFSAGKRDGKLGRGGKYWYGDDKQTTVFNFPKPSRNKEHPTMKPVGLIQAMLKNSCPKGGLVIDIFGGSGSTLIAAYGLKMRAFLVELDPKYGDVICRRFEEHTGIIPIVNGEKRSFVKKKGEAEASG